MVASAVMERPLIKIGSRFINVLAIKNTERHETGAVSVWLTDSNASVQLDPQQGNVFLRVLRKYAIDADNPV